MISLEQVRQLEAKVNRAVEIIRTLREENRALQRSMGASQARMKELEELVRVFKSDQAEIEKGLVNAIRKLDQLENGLEAVRRSEEGEAATAGSGARGGPAAGPAAEISQIGAEGQPGQLDIF